MSRTLDASLFLSMSLIWALNYPLVKIALQYEPPLMVVMFRIVIGGIASLVFIAGKMDMHMSTREHLLILITGLLNSFLFMAFWFLGEEGESASLTSIIIYTFPIINVVLSRAFLDERVGAKRTMGAGIGFAGLLLIFADQLYLRFNVDIVLLALAALSWSVSAVIFKKYLHGTDVRKVNALQFIYAIPFIVALSFGTEKLLPDWTSATFIAVMLYMGVPGSAVAYLIYFRMVRKYDVSVISAYFFTVPALAVALSFLLLHEVNSIYVYGGFALIAAGIYMSSMNAANG